ncbi:hypothetical protein TNCV_3082091 [Trichonephila clavipes]|nr:hypothetical protein TNCV_3082091 [Trichonephila clavipes]
MTLMLPSLLPGTELAGSRPTQIVSGQVPTSGFSFPLVTEGARAGASKVSPVCVLECGIMLDERNAPSETELAGVGAPKVVTDCISAWGTRIWIWNSETPLTCRILPDEIKWLCVRVLRPDFHFL